LNKNKEKYLCKISYSDFVKVFDKILNKIKKKKIFRALKSTTEALKKLRQKKSANWSINIFQKVFISRSSVKKQTVFRRNRREILKYFYFHKKLNNQIFSFK